MDCKLIIFFGVFITSQLFYGHSHVAVSKKSPHWGPWSAWSSCTNKTEVGSRVRSRLCIGRSCAHLPGENYELQLCSQNDGELRSQKKSFIDKCRYDPQMNNTLSCKLYLENPAMAYSIFKSTNCLFDSMTDRNDEFEPEIRTSNLTLLQRLSNAHLQDSGLQHFVFVNGSLINLTANPFAFSRKGKTKSLHRFCQKACRKFVLRASDTSSRSSTVQLQQNNRDLSSQSNSTTSMHYKICMKNCRISRGVYNALEMNWRNGNFASPEGAPKLCMDLKEEQKENLIDAEDRNIKPNVLLRKRRETSSSNHAEAVRRPYILSLREYSQMEEDALYARRPGVSKKIIRRDQRLYGRKLASNPSPELVHHVAAILEEDSTNKNKKKRRTHIHAPRVPRSSLSYAKENLTFSRSKRQLAPGINASRYRSPCYETTDYSATPRVLNLDSSMGELFFYEGRQQRFLRRRCSGSAVVPGSLFRPRESVTQTSTGRLALCKQGFLKRYGLLIQLDPQGVFAFNDGERFSVKFKPFKLESHCALSTYE